MKRAEKSPPGIELPQLETFVKAAQLGSFTAAAVELQVTQVAVSKRIAQLEAELGVSLFDRQARHVELTPAGRALYETARQILDLHRQAREAVAGKRMQVSGELLLAASSIPGEYLLPQLLEGFREQFPQVQVKATIADSGSVIRDVQRGHATLGLVGKQPDAPDMEVRPLAEDAVVLIAPATSEWRKRSKITLPELLKAPLIVREAESGSRWCLQQGLEAAGMAWSDLTVALELGNNAAICDAVRRGLGIGFVSQLAVNRDLKDGRLLVIEVKNFKLHRRLYVTFDRRRPLPPSAQAFLRYLETRPTPRSGE